MKNAVKKAVRKPGQRKENYDDESTPDLLKWVKMLIRMDFGGISQGSLKLNGRAWVKKKMAEQGIECGDHSADAIVELIDHQIKGNKARANPRIDEAIKRTSEDGHVPPVEVLP